MLFDPSNPKHAPIIDRLEIESHGWLTTVFPDGRPAASLIWFLWHDGELVVYSEETPKVTNIAGHPKVSFNLNSDDDGGSVLAINGTAVVDRTFPRTDQLTEYGEKYDLLIAGLGMTPVSFADAYRVPIRITPERFRAW